MKIFFAIFLCGLLLLGACTSLHKVSPVSQTRITRVLLNGGVKVKHPIEHNAQEGTQSLQEPVTCDDLETLNPKAQACLNSIKEGDATYAYRFETSPRLEWKDSTPSAVCLKDALPAMKLPREIYFLAQSEARPDEWECYAVNLNTEVGVVADITLPWDRYKLLIHFPLTRPLKTEADLQLWHTVNLLSSIKAEMGGKLKASMVTESLCKRCFKNVPQIEDKRRGKLPPVIWE